MSRQRAISDAGKIPHSLSLKVLRLSRPQISYQSPLPEQDAEDDYKIRSQAALSYPSSHLDDRFILSPLLTLPPSFGTTHVGETFSCTLCANNELSNTDDVPTINGVRITASMQTPSQPDGIPLDLQGASDDFAESSTLESHQTLQRLVRFELREEGNHVLAVTLSYTETQQMEEGQAAIGGRARTFRKLYQFAAQQLLSVRTKSQTMPSNEGSATRYALEAQLENLSEEAVVLESVDMIPKLGISCKTMNAWQLPQTGDSMVAEKPLLSRGHILQSAFLLHELPGAEESLEYTRDGRAVLGQISLQWRSAMGDVGSLSTGWLSCKRSSN
ncbi:MAG: hypothetical protein M1828_007126 [Chrysothrix sp. TS-e1954]|nr:MAG: hypothetical protein M1828_007126 [Chrysothrix sp. TS-e1954]